MPLKIQILSDVHTEFFDDYGKNFLEEYLKPDETDILVIAGDLGTGKSIVHSIITLRRLYKDKPILFVPGNHEFYGSSFKELRAAMESLEQKVKNLKFMYNRMEVIEGVQFVGTPLWFPFDEQSNKDAHLLNDFTQIEGFRYLVDVEHKACMKFLDWHVNEDSIIITHHCPSFQSIPAEYKDSALNQFFAVDLDDFIKERKPRAWIHGHTHSSFNYLLDETHILCNPLGYMGQEINPAFEPNLIVEIE